MPKDILHRVKLLAVEQQTSVSNLLTRALTSIVEQEERYTHAQRRHLQLLESAFDLGTRGKIKTKREQLHERR